MEIDFLGLNSPKCKLVQESPKSPHTDTVGGVEVSLSLSRSSSSLSYSDKKKWESPDSEKMMVSRSSTVCSLASYNQEKTEQPSLLLVAPPVFRRAGFLYDTNLRVMSQLSAEQPASVTNVFTQPQKAKNTAYISGNTSTGLSAPGTGYTPTVAMARRATLARFLEKRLHRMNQARSSHLMGRSLSATNYEVVETTMTRSNKKDNDLKRR